MSCLCGNNRIISSYEPTRRMLATLAFFSPLAAVVTLALISGVIHIGAAAFPLFIII